MISQRPLQVAVLCGHLDLSGGLMRFERFGRVARRRGHDVVFVTAPDPQMTSHDVV